MQRVEGFRDGMIAASLLLEEGLFVEGAFDFESGIKAGEHLLTQGQRPTAIFATNDDLALGALTGAPRLKLRVPDDLSVVGFDDTPAGLARKSVGQGTSVSVRVELGGRRLRTTKT